MPTKGRKTTEVRQKQIIHAAGALIFKHGSEHLTVRGIAAEVGISEAAIYRHFKSKKSILSFLLQHIEETLLNEITKETTANGPITLASIDNVIRNHFSLISMRKGVSFQVVAEVISLGDRNLNRQAFETIGKYIARLKDLLTAGIRDGTVRSDIDIEASATMLFAMIQGLVNIWSLSNGGFKLIDRYTALWRIYSAMIANP